MRNSDCYESLPKCTDYPDTGGRNEVFPGIVHDIFFILSRDGRKKWGNGIATRRYVDQGHNRYNMHHREVSSIGLTDDIIVPNLQMSGRDRAFGSGVIR